MRKLVTAIIVLVSMGLAARPAKAADQPRTMDQVIDRIVVQENRLNQDIRKFSPLVETYIQNLRPDPTMGYVPAGDKYFLSRADFSKGVNLVSLTDADTKGKKFFSGIGNFFSFAMQYLPDGFLQMIFIDTNGFDKQHYKFDYVRREFLGEVRCLVFDVTPESKQKKGRFLGRIWVEDQDFHIVRFNGDYEGGGHASWYFHFDSWRTNAQPGLWLPSFVYSEEKDLHYALTKKLAFKAQTRLWGYNLGHAGEEQELSRILVETPVQDESKTNNDLTPVQAQRSWDRQAEDNVVDRLQRIGLMSPPGEVDKALDTVVNNLEVTNNLDIDPEVRCRVLMTTTLESFTLGHTIVLSRGLIDVLPDEASFATIIAHELGHVVLGHRMDTTYAFFDQLLVDDKETFRHFGFARTPEEEQAASTKAQELLNNSPYKNQLANAGLFVAALQQRQKEIPNLISPHLGDRVPNIATLSNVSTMQTQAQAPAAQSADPKKNTQAIAALPIGGRVKLDVWYDRLELIKSKPVGTIAEREKMPFEVTPFMPYLTRFTAEKAAANMNLAEPKPANAVANDSANAPDTKPADPAKPQSNAAENKPADPPKPR
jgi:Peptidase family M48